MTLEKRRLPMRTIQRETWKQVFRTLLWQTPRCDPSRRLSEYQSHWEMCFLGSLLPSLDLSWMPTKAFFLWLGKVLASMRYPFSTALLVEPHSSQGKVPKPHTRRPDTDDWLGTKKMITNFKAKTKNGFHIPVMHKPIKVFGFLCWMIDKLGLISSWCCAEYWYLNLFRFTFSLFIFFCFFILGFFVFDRPFLVHWQRHKPWHLLIHQ